MHAKNGTLGHVLLSCVKDEAPYLLEFVAHHRVLGFDGIYIAANDSTDGTNEVLAALDAAGAIRHALNEVPEGTSPQRAGYALLREHFRLNRAEWLAALDVDEFLCVAAGGGRVQDLTAAAGPQVDAIVLNAVTFGSAPFDAARLARVCARFPVRLPPHATANTSLKSITRAPRRFRAVNNHCMVGPKKPVAVMVMRANGETYEVPPDVPMWSRMRTSTVAEIRHDLAWYNHYAVKSPEEYLLRQRRGRGAVPLTKGGDNDRHTEEYFAIRANARRADDRVLAMYGPAVEAEMARLLAVPAVAAAQARAEAGFCARVAALDDGAEVRTDP